MIANARLRRELRFTPLAVADVAAEVGFLVTAIVAVYLGYPTQSLLIGLAVRLFVHGVIVWGAEPYFPRSLPRIAAARDFARFSTSVFVGRVITLGSGNIDYILIGRLLGSSALGYYSIGWDLLKFVPSRLHRVAGRVAFPAFARIKDNDAELRRAYRRFFDYVTRFVLPVSGCIAIAAPEIIAGVYGHTWIPAAGPLRMLAVGLTALGIRIWIGAVFYAKDYPSLDIYLMGGRFVLLATVVILTAPYGLVAVSGGASAVETLTGIVGQAFVCSLIAFSWREVFAAMAPGAKVAIACMLATAAGRAIGIWAGAEAHIMVALVAIPPAIVFCWMQWQDAIYAMNNFFGSKTLIRAAE